jgi:methionyl-tRNA synthetase
MSIRKILTTMALPYANGPIHLGHMVEAIQTDIWVRFQKLRGHNCLFICGNDAHGTPIMLSAQKQGITPEALIETVHKNHTRDYSAFHINFDNFYTTHSDENRTLSQNIYTKLQDNGDIASREISQAYDPEKNMFLPDRFIRGECPKCGADDQYGDSCESCGSTYDPTELKNPRSAVSGATPIEKQSLHYFFKLEKYEAFLKSWMHEGHLQEHVANKLDEWFNEGLKQWDISRDAPYFGFEIPNAPNKFFYVWLDAPIGYIASHKNYCDTHNTGDFDSYWNADSDTELYHFVGKDIVYFHALFWPAVLKGAGYRTPTAIFVHGFLTVNGKKMSKSRGTFITAQDYADKLNPEYLRYYYAAKLSSHVEDIDLNLEDFALRVNSDLVGKVVNIASRCAGFIYKKYEATLAAQHHNPELYQKLAAAQDSIATDFEALNYGKAVRTIMSLADNVNQYIDHMQPWQLAKLEDSRDEVQRICTQAINCFRVLMIYLKPILPAMADAVEEFLAIPALCWSDIEKPLFAHTINKFKPLMQRVDTDLLNELAAPDEEKTA